MNKFEGLISGVVQFGTAWLVVEVVSRILPGGSVSEGASLLVAGFTFAYGTALGVWNSFYQNWRKRGGRLMRDLKAMSMSFGYYFGVTTVSQFGAQDVVVIDPTVSVAQTLVYLETVYNSVITDPVQVAQDQLNSFTDWLKSLSTTAALLAATAKVHVYHNFLANNEFKNWGFWMQSIPEIERRDLKVYKTIPLPIDIENIGKKDKSEKYRTLNIEVPLGPGISQRFLNRQIIFYLPVMTAKLIDQMWFTWSIGPAINGDLPAYVPYISVLGYWTTVMGSVYWLNWWAYKNHQKAAQELKINQEVMSHPLHRTTKVVLDPVVSVAKSTTKVVLDPVVSVAKSTSKVIVGAVKKVGARNATAPKCSTVLVPDDVK